MNIDTNTARALVKFISKQYKDEDAGSKLEIFIGAYQEGWADATTNAAEYVAEWANPMDSMHEGTTKNLLLEIADGIAQL